MLVKRKDRLSFSLCRESNLIIRFRGNGNMSRQLCVFCVSVCFSSDFLTLISCRLQVAGWWSSSVMVTFSFYCFVLSLFVICWTL